MGVVVGRISAKGQITVPADVRKELGVNFGDHVIFRVEDGRVLLEAMTDVAPAKVSGMLSSALANTEPESDVADNQGSDENSSDDQGVSVSTDEEHSNAVVPPESDVKRNTHLNPLASRLREPK